MKRIFIIQLILLLAQCSFSQSNNLASPNCNSYDSSLYSKLQSLDFNDFKGKSVQTFLNSMEFEYKTIIPSQSKPGYISKVIFGFTDSLSIDLWVSDLKQRKPLNFGYTFNFEVFKKKTISSICFRYGGRCIKGCDNEYCD